MSYETRYAAAKRAGADRRDELPEAREWRRRDALAREQAERDMRERYPVITAANFEEACGYRERRRNELIHSTEGET